MPKPYAAHWMERYIENEPARRMALNVPADSIPFGPSPAQRTDLHRPTYWSIDLSDYPNARFALNYAGSNNPAQCLSLFYPEGFVPGKDEPLPVLIYVHGGGFRGGSSSNGGKTLLYTAEASLYALMHGYAVAAVDYRLMPEIGIIPMVCDVKAAIRYLRANAAKLGLDGNRFALLGESAGGYLVNMAGLAGDHPLFNDPEMGNADVSSRVQAVVSWYSIFDVDPANMKYLLRDGETMTENELAEFARRIAPATYADENAPAFLIQHGTKDREVDYHNSIHLYETVCAATGEENHALDIAANADHAVRWFISRRNAERIVKWLDEKLK